MHRRNDPDLRCVAVRVSLILPVPYRTDPNAEAPEGPPMCLSTHTRSNVNTLHLLKAYGIRTDRQNSLAVNRCDKNRENTGPGASNRGNTQFGATRHGIHGPQAVAAIRHEGKSCQMNAGNACAVEIIRCVQSGIRGLRMERRTSHVTRRKQRHRSPLPGRNTPRTRGSSSGTGGYFPRHRRRVSWLYALVSWCFWPRPDSIIPPGLEATPPIAPCKL